MTIRRDSLPPTSIAKMLLQARLWGVWLALTVVAAAAIPLLGHLLDQSAASLLVAGVIGLAALLFIFRNPTWGLYLLVLTVFSIHWFTDALLIVPKPFNLIPDVLVITVFASGLLRRLRRGWRLPRTPVDGLVLAFIGVSALSHVLNQSDSVLVFLNGLYRQNLKFILLFYAIVYLSPSERTLRRLITLIVGLSLLQIPVTLIQFVIYRSGYVTIGPNQFLWDYAGGTLGSSSTGVLSLLSLMMMSLLFGLAQATRQGWYAILAFSFFIPAVAGEGKIVFVLAPLTILFLLTYKRAILRARTLLLLGVFALVFVLSLVTLQFVLPEAKSLDVLTSLSFTSQNYERGLSATGGFPQSRVGDVEFTLQLLSVDATQALIGYGPGSSSHAFTEAANGSLYQRYADFQGPYFYFSFIQLSTTLLEYGVVGLIIYLLMLWRLYRYNNRLLVKTRHLFWRGVAWGFRGIVFIFVVSTVYWRVWSTEALASVVWALAGIIIVQVQRLDSPSPISANPLS